MLEQDRQYNPENPRTHDIVTMFSSYGVRIAILKNPAPITHTFRGIDEVIPAGKVIGEVVFTPFGREFDEKNRFQTVALAVRGMDNFFTFLHEAVNQGMPIERPEYLLGGTNVRMAKFAEHIGFRTSIIDEEKDYVHTVGLTDAVEEGMNLLKKRHNGQFTKHLYERARRENPHLWNVDPRHPQPEMVVAQINMPSPEEMQRIQTLLRDETGRLHRKNLILTAGVKVGSGVNMGLGIGSFLSGNYLGGTLETVLGAGLYATQLPPVKRRYVRWLAEKELR